jgi:hypothetical protein
MRTHDRKTTLAALAALLLAACGDDEDTALAPGGDASATAPARVRIAHLSPDAPRVDVCLAAAGTGRFGAPVLEGAGGGTGLAYGEVTRYVEVAAGSYDVRVVAAAAADCTTPAVPDTAGVAVGAGRAYTVAATGLVAPEAGEPAFALVPFADDTAVSPGKVKLRFIHASPGTPAVDVGTGAGGSFTPVFTAVSFPETDGDASPSGYVETDPLSGVTLSARATGTAEDALVLPGVTLPAGAIVTVFAAGLLGSDPPLSALVCPDGADAAGLLSDCDLATP